LSAPDILPFESWDEVFAVAGAAGRYRPLVVFACATGLRPEEWSALQWRDVDRRTRRCAIRRTYADGELRSEGKRDASLRIVLLADLALDTLDELPQPLRSERLLFSAPGGGHINLSNWRRRVWYPALEKARLERRPLYQMRHTFATLALAAGMPIDFVSRQLGHTDIRTTAPLLRALHPRARGTPPRDAQRRLEDDGGGARGARWPVGASRGHRLRERLELPLSMGQ